MIFFGRTIISETAYDACEFVVIRGYGPAITEASQVLSRIKAVSGGIAEASGTSAVVKTSVCLSIIFY